MRIPDWLESLLPHAPRLLDEPLSAMLARAPERIESSTLRLGPLQACFARQRLDAEAEAALFEVARQRDVAGAIADLFDGVAVNRSENRAALHTALRSNLGTRPQAQAAQADAAALREQMRACVHALQASGVTDLINIGIGGSHLGPQLAMDALDEFRDGRLRTHFLSSSDGRAVTRLLRRLVPEQTAAVLVSKSFGTQEALLNGQAVRDWLGGSERLYAVTAQPEKAQAFGIEASRILLLRDWVGGRFSLWSSVGLIVAAGLGMPNFERLLAGAALMDAHVRQAPLEQNLAVRHGLLALWNRNVLGYASQVVVPYDSGLRWLPAWLQQLVMESLGKSATQDGKPVGCATAPVIWGGAGSDAQHSFFQALHQGHDTVPVEFIGVLNGPGPQVQRRMQLANLLAQSEALMRGAPNADLQRHYPGNRPSTTLLLDALTPEALGALLALYEHSVLVQATVWGINAFDQWGVELGKRVASGVLAALDAPAAQGGDAVTAQLLTQIRAARLDQE